MCGKREMSVIHWNIMYDPNCLLWVVRIGPLGPPNLHHGWMSLPHILVLLHAFPLVLERLPEPVLVLGVPEEGFQFSEVRRTWPDNLIKLG